MDREQRIERGRQKGRALLGDRWDRIEAGLRETSAELTDYVMEFAYGEIYQRPALDDRSREIISITCLAMLGLAPQLKTHVLAGRAAGLTEVEIQEIFIHMAMYAGFPTALFGIQTAREVMPSVETVEG